MTIKHTKHNIIYALLMAICTGALFNVVLVHHIKNTFIDNFVGVDLDFETNLPFEADLYYAFEQGFVRGQKIRGNHEKLGTLSFNFPELDSVPTKIRLDFENIAPQASLHINRMSFVFKDGKTALDENRLFDHIFLNSGAVNLDKNNKTILFRSQNGPFDPYIVFDPVLFILWKNHPLKLPALLLPFLFIAIFYLIKYRSWAGITVMDALLVGFIICIPLKIAWTTFLGLLVCAWSLYRSIIKRKFNFKNHDGLLLLGFFVVLMVFGRATDLKVFDHQLALVVFYVVLSSGEFNWEIPGRFYVYFFLGLNAILLAFGIAFLLNFREIFGSGLTTYFWEVKTYSGNIRDWLYYDHAVFLTFFGILGLLFMKDLPEFNQGKKELKGAYHILLVLVIILFGARISLLIYLVYALNLLVKTTPIKRVLCNTVVFILAGAMLLVYINSIDQNRSGLWSASWEAIKERPLMGYGLGSSDRVLHNAHIMKEAGADISNILNHSHNQFFTFLLEIGFLGCTAIMIMIVLYFKENVRYKSTTLVLFVFGLCYVFLTESILQTSKPLFVLCLLFALMTKTTSQRTPNVIK